LVADEKFVKYQNYRVKKTVVSFLKKKLGRTLPELIALAKREDPDYEDTLQFLLENPRKTPSQIKRDLESEILELAANSARDDEGSDIITLKAVKKVLTRSGEFKFLL
jgi:predicted patatin/cPLA2 family phospholipase